MFCLDANRIVDHHCALEAAEGTSGQGALAGFDNPRLGRCVVQVELDDGVGVVGVGMGEVVVVGCCIVDEACSVLEDVDANEVALFVVFDKLEGAFEDLLGPLEVPPEFHVAAEASSGVQTAVAPSLGAWVTAD